LPRRNIRTEVNPDHPRQTCREVIGDRDRDVGTPIRIPARNLLLVGQCLCDERLDGHFHQFERDRDGAADMNFVLIV
jgi:hypothetical protein